MRPAYLTRVTIAFLFSVRLSSFEEKQKEWDQLLKHQKKETEIAQVKRSEAEFNLRKVQLEKDKLGDTVKTKTAELEGSLKMTTAELKGSKEKVEQLQKQNFEKELKACELGKDKEMLEARLNQSAASEKVSYAKTPPFLANRKGNSNLTLTLLS